MLAAQSPSRNPTAIWPLFARILFILATVLTPVLGAASEADLCESKLVSSESYQAFKDDMVKAGTEFDRLAWLKFVTWAGDDFKRKNVLTTVPWGGPVYINRPQTSLISEFISRETIFKEQDYLLTRGPIVDEAIEFMLLHLAQWNRDKEKLPDLIPYQEKLISKLSGIGSRYSLYDLLGLTRLFLYFADLHLVVANSHFSDPQETRFQNLIKEATAKVRNDSLYENPKPLGMESQSFGFLTIPTPRKLGFSTLLDGWAHGVSFLGLTVEASNVDGAQLVPSIFYLHDLDHTRIAEFTVDTTTFGKLPRGEILRLRQAMRDFSKSQATSRDEKLNELVAFYFIHEENNYFLVDPLLQDTSRRRVAQQILDRMEQNDLGQAFEERPTWDEMRAAVKRFRTFLEEYRRVSK